METKKREICVILVSKKMQNVTILFWKNDFNLFYVFGASISILLDIFNFDQCFCKNIYICVFVSVNICMFMHANVHTYMFTEFTMPYACLPMCGMHVPIYTVAFKP